MNHNDTYQVLLNRKQEIMEQIERKRDILQTPVSEYTDELSAYDQHPGDLGSDTFEREKELGLLEMLEFEMSKINEALVKFDNGSYGICDQCGGTIEPARQRRLPNTTVCAACAQNHANRFHRPAEEEVIPASRVFNTGFDIAGYSVDEYKDSDSKVQD